MVRITNYCLKISGIVLKIEKQFIYLHPQFNIEVAFRGVA